MQNPSSSPWPWRRGFLTRLDSFDTNHRCVSGLGRWSCGVAVSRGEFWQTTDGGFYTTRRLARITSERPSSDSNSSRSRRGSQSCALLPEFPLLKRHTAHRIRSGDKAKSATSSCLLRLASSARFTTPDPFSFLFFLPNRNVPFSMKSGFFFKKRQKS